MPSLPTGTLFLWCLRLLPWSSAIGVAHIDFNMHGVAGRLEMTGTHRLSVATLPLLATVLTVSRGINPVVRVFSRFGIFALPRIQVSLRQCHPLPS